MSGSLDELLKANLALIQACDKFGFQKYLHIH